MNHKNKRMNKTTIRILLIQLFAFATILATTALFFDYIAKNNKTTAFLYALSLIIIIFVSILYGKTIKADRMQLKQVNKKLKENEKLLKTFFNQSPVGIALGEGKYSLIDVNPKFEEIMGRPKKELKETTWVDFTHPDDIQADSDNLDLLYEGKIDGYSMKKIYQARWVDSLG